MPTSPAGRAVLGAIAAVFVAGPVLADGPGDHAPDRGRRLHRQTSAHSLAPEIRYRDPRYVPRRRAFRQAPDFLIQAYLPRNTETPIYNEPPSRFPPR